MQEEIVHVCGLWFFIYDYFDFSRFHETLKKVKMFIYNYVSGTTTENEINVPLALSAFIGTKVRDFGRV